MPEFQCTVMYERTDGTIGEDETVVEARDIDEACEIAEQAVATKGQFFFSDVRLL